MKLTTRDRYINLVSDQIAMRSRPEQPVDKTAIETWATRQLERLKEQGRLVTEQQYQDYRSGRRLKVGDAVKYIGDERAETASDGKTYIRPKDQVGRIVAEKDNVFTFRPDANAAETRIVDLQVRFDTPGYFLLERLTSA